MRRIRRIFPTVLVITALAGPVAVAATVASGATPLAAHSNNHYGGGAATGQPRVYYHE
jgi:peptidoglycan/LPS O-acetylase OafA/YrhL